MSIKVNSFVVVLPKIPSPELPSFQWIITYRYGDSECKKQDSYRGCYATTAARSKIQLIPTASWCLRWDI